MKGLIARVDGTREIVDIVDGTLLHYAQGVVGGTIEIVSVPTPIGEVSVFVNDNGFAEGLELNRFATALCGERGWHDPIVGDILVLGGADYEGNTLPLSDEVARVLSTIEVVRGRARA